MPWHPQLSLQEPTQGSDNRSKCQHLPMRRQKPTAKKEGKGASLVWWPLICVWRGVVFCLVRVVGYSSNWSNKAKKGVVTVVGCDTLE